MAASYCDLSMYSSFSIRPKIQSRRIRAFSGFDKGLLVEGAFGRPAIKAS